MKFYKLLATALLTGLLAMVILPFALAAPTFTGSAPADFTDDDVFTITDSIGDVAVVAGPTAGGFSGWDVAAIYFDYDHDTDIMYIGIDCHTTICGDADGDGNPGSMAGGTGTDYPDLDQDETFTLLLDTNLNADGAGNGDFEAAVGVAGNTDITDFGTYSYTNGGLVGGAQHYYGPSYNATNPTVLFANPSTAQPDLEFSIANFSTLPNFNFTPGDRFSFNIYLFAGSTSDQIVTEESLPDTGVAQVTIPGLATIGDYVWEDANADGIQDATETGIEGVTVNLYDGSDNLISTTTTNAGGYYSFTHLMPGDYYIQFEPPTGYQVSPQDQGGDDALDSDADPATGQTITTSLVLDEVDLTWDAGLYQLASLGDYVWYDLDVDGIQDANETGVNGVTVRLWADTTGDDLPDQVISTTTTITNGGQAGYYEFLNLTPGVAYQVEFVPPTNYALTFQDQGSDDSLDSDADQTTARTQIVFLQSGEHNPTLDAGIASPQLEISKAQSSEVVDGEISFTILITNTGPSTLDVVPLSDQFTGPVAYIGGTPAADTVDNDNGALSWDDLTLSFNRDLAPGETFTVETVFRLTTVSTQFTMTNAAAVNGSQDEFDNSVSDTAHTPVNLINIPTAIELLYFEAQPHPKGVRLQWATAVEIDTYGFRLLRSPTDRLADAQQIAFLVGANPNGSEYSFIDEEPGQSYWLVEVDTYGLETTYGPFGLSGLEQQEIEYRYFLPVILK